MIKNLRNQFAEMNGLDMDAIKVYNYFVSCHFLSPLLHWFIIIRMCKIFCLNKKSVHKHNKSKVHN